MTYPAQTTMEIHAISSETAALRIIGPVQLQHAAEFARALEQLFARSEARKALDLSQTTYLTSTAIGALLTRHRELARRGQDILVWGCSQSIWDIFQMIKLDHLFEIISDPPVYPRRQEAESRFTISWLCKNADQQLHAPGWSLWAYERLVYVQVHGRASIASADNCLSETWGVLLRKREEYGEAFLLLNTDAMPLQTTHFRNFLKNEWAFVLDQPEYRICLIDRGVMKRVVWEATFKLLGKHEQIGFFADAEAALSWVERLVHPVGANGSEMSPR